MSILFLGFLIVSIVLTFAEKFFGFDADALIQKIDEFVIAHGPVDTTNTVTVTPVVADTDDDFVADTTDDDYITINAVPSLVQYNNKGIANNIHIAGISNIDNNTHYMSYPADIVTTNTTTDTADLSALLKHDFYAFDEVDYTNYTSPVSEVSYADGDALINTDALIHVTDIDVLVDVKGMRKNIALAPKGVCIDEVINRAAFSRNCWNHSRIRKEGKITRVKPEWRR